MGRKAGKFKKKEDRGPLKKNTLRFNPDNEDMMDDEIDAFHKNRDVVPLNINEDVASDEDNEQPVLDFQDDEDDEDEDIDDDDDDDKPPKGLAAKIVRTQKYLRSKFGDAEDEVLDDADEEEQSRVVWGKKSDMYGADVDEPQSSDDEDAAEEEREVLKLQSEKSKVLSMEDFGLEDSPDETDRELTFEEILDRKKSASKGYLDKGIKDEEGITCEVVKKDLSALTKEEQMDAVYSSAPELIGLLSELNDALEQLEKKVNPLVEKIRGQESARKAGTHYIEVKQILLQSFCQAITFYLLLKSEGQPVRDHPVVSRLVEIKSLLDKIKEMDDNLSFDVEDILKKDMNTPAVKSLLKTAPVESYSLNSSHPLGTSADQATVEPNKEAGLNTSKSTKIKESQHKHQDKQQVGQQSLEMLKIRESLEEKLKQQGLFSSIAPKAVRTTKIQQPVNRQLETFDDFVDEAMAIDALANGKTSQQLTLRPNKRKVVAGDDDIPQRDDIGERRRKHELRVLAGAGVKYADGVEDDPGNLYSDGGADANGESDVDGESGSDSDLEFYKQVERQHAERLAAKSAKYSRTPEVSSLPETVDGKRHISNQIEKNRGLTRARKKLIKNPRKKYKLKHKKAEVRRKGQVRDIRKATGSYGGEASGINAGISRSVRFKS